MTELEFAIPREESSIIKVIGVGGGGNNAVNRMHELDVKGVDFIVCNTDSQALLISPVATKITLGASLTEGRGAGNNPEKGKEAAIESLPEIEKVLDNNTKMVFITAGMGGGTGTGAAPVIAKAAKERDILTVAIVSIPFLIEGATRINQALQGINEMKQYVDALLVINNERLNEIYKNMKFTDAFKLADDILATATKGIAEIITVTGYINVDFEDVKTVMKDSGVALMGSATAEGEERDVEAIKQALEFPLLKDNDIKGAKNILLNIISSKGDYELGMSEFGRITNYLKEVVGKDTNTNIIWGTGFDDSLGEKISVTIIATGFDANKELYIKQDKIKVNLLDDDFEEDEFDIDEKEEDINPEIGQNTIELELDFSPSSQTESEIILPNLDPKNYEHMKDLNKLNDTNFLEGLENQPANERMKNIDKD
ncbi:MAG: cell division protein FtsZ [Bacteroidota bacterium]|jgi:cell division protein FtsZ|nr:cell division protein FtsZ [Bacteroidales bacterium]MDI9536136.1 cell division protein FtsZ [Bacteroidota bacterium]NLP20949.1 cell division protein FtsZ [Bacteroidales bacterium]OQC46752.1 MAG: Cell division protein FtsZ [Bacteroidetes bacterium ADurb.Bin028]HNY43471.1 cell division protein FtsZ [Bacteroidales bacterium]